MNSGETQYVWQHPEWPHWRYQLPALAPLLQQVHRAQGHLAGRLADFGSEVRDEASLRTFTEDAVKTSEIEGEVLAPSSVRSSVARRLGIDAGAVTPEDRQVEGVVQMVLDATRNYAAPLTADRLCGWQAALFPTGRSGMHRITVGAWRGDELGPMRIVSGPYGREKVHYQAPPAERLPAEMAAFLHWFEQPSSEDALLRAGLAHLWFITIHPFEDGNGRTGRAVCDLALTRAEQTPHRYYSFSAQAQRDRDDYYQLLERTQKGNLDATAWLEWFLNSLLRALEAAEKTVDEVLAKARFWQRWSTTVMNERQIRMLNKLLDGFEGKLTSSKWAKITKSSADTALRDISELVALGVLQKAGAGGRSTHYLLL